MREPWLRERVWISLKRTLSGLGLEGEERSWVVEKALAQVSQAETGRPPPGTHREAVKGEFPRNSGHVSDLVSCPRY